MDWPEAVLAIIIVVTIGRVMKTRYRAENGISEDKEGNAMVTHVAPDPDAGRLQDEVSYLKERVAVLEKIATDGRGARELENEIEKLRDQ